MSTNVGSIHYDLGLNTSEFDKKAAGISSTLSSVGKKMSSIGTTMTLGVTLPIVAGFGFAIKGASDLNETLNKVDVAFKDQAKTVRAWGETTLKSMGLAKGSALDAAALFGDMATSMGLPTEKASDMSMKMVQLGGDLSSFKNISFAEVQTALAGVFTGETESLKRLGIIMTDTNVKAYALSQGFKGNWEELSQAEKVTWRYNYVMEMTKNAQGDFARTFNGTANQIRYSKERLKELTAEFGEKLLPITGRVLEFLNKLLDKFTNLTPAQQDMVIKLAAIAAVIGPVLLVLGKLTEAVATLAPLMANPTFWIVVAVLAAIAAIAYVVYQNWDKIKEALKPVVDLFNYMKPSLEIIVSLLRDQLAQTLNTLKQSWNELYANTKPYHDELKMFAQFVGAVLVGAIIVVALAITGLIVVGMKLVGWIAQAISWWISLGSSIDQSMNRARSAVFGTIGSIISWFASLPGRISGAVGSMGGILSGAGRAVMDGLFNGINSGYQRVKDLVGGIANWIKSHKGPIEKDRVLLINEGVAIMGGLNKGLKMGYKSVQDTVSGINASLVGTMTPEQTAQQSISSDMSIYGDVNIGSKQDADYFFERMNRQQEVIGLGLAPMGGM
jgi:phage-related protein